MKGDYRIQVIRKLYPASNRNVLDQTLVKREEEYFVVSTVGLPAKNGGGFETLVFPADKNGEIKDWLEVAGGRGMSQQDAIEQLAEVR